MTPSFVWFEELSAGDTPVAGGKGANLGEMSWAGLQAPSNIPEFTEMLVKFVNIELRQPGRGGHGSDHHRRRRAAPAPGGPSDQGGLRPMSDLTATGGIVVGVDGSQPSRDALRWAMEEAQLRRRSVDVVHV